MSDEIVNGIHVGAIRHCVICCDDDARHPLRLGAVHMARLIEIIGGLLLAVAVGFLIAFVFLNFMLGCETWDESLWTETNSCITVTQIWEGITHD